MSELILMVGTKKSDVVDALKMKIFLEDREVELNGIITDNSAKGPIPKKFLGEILGLKIISPKSR